MNLHDADINRRLGDFLERRQAPRSFAGNEKAKADQIAAYARTIRRYAPQGDALDDWWRAVMENLSAVSETWAWPSEKDLWTACQEGAKKVGTTASTDWAPDSMAINLRRLESDEPIGEHWLWGRNALRLVAGGGNRVLMRERRLRHAKQLAETYGIDEARRMLLELKAKHEAAEETVRLIQEGHDRPHVGAVAIPDKRVFSTDELERLIA